MKNKYITSVQNPLIKMIIELQNKKSARKKEKLFIVEGMRSVNEIPEHFKVAYYVTTEHFNQNQLPRLEEGKWIIVTEEIYKIISGTESPQGIMAVVQIPSVVLKDLQSEEKGFYLVLENLQDPGNLGTIIRTAHAFGAKAVLITKGSVDLYSPKVVRSTMGSLFHIPICIDYEIQEYISYLQKLEIPIYVTALEEAKPIFHINFNNPLAIVIGNEGNGISDYLKETADYKMMIPMPGGSESLNASVATSICIYEVMRQLQMNSNGV